MFEKMTWYNKLPDDSQSVYEPYMNLFFETMYERQLIWKRRFIDKKEKPWTKNKIFQQYKFTNVYRELDKNSQWEIKNIILDDSLDLRNIVWKIMVFRFFNNPKTFTFSSKGKIIQPNLFGNEIKSGLEQAQSVSDLIDSDRWRNGIPNYEEYDEDEFSRFIAGIRSVGINPYTNAYLINSKAAPGMSRDFCYTKVVMPTLHENIDNIIDVVRKANNPEEIIFFLKKLPSVADFIAHEFYQDFTYIPRYTGRKFMKFDQNDYTNVGPGASLGIRLIYPSLKNIKDQKKAIYWLRGIADQKLDSIGKKRGEPFPYIGWDIDKGEYYTFTYDDVLSGDMPLYNQYDGITLHQIEMWLCEFQKYWKMIIGEGKQRTMFNPISNNLIRR